MLGARARAAEYNAFKAASARQASREAEEQKLPPKHVPVSLSAFTKNQQLNRNKGNKNWIPLVLDDNVQDDSKPIEDTAGSSLASVSKCEPEDDSESLPESSSSTTGTTSKMIRVHIPEIPIPIAPKAMIEAMSRQASALPPSQRTYPQLSKTDSFKLPPIRTSNLSYGTSHWNDPIDDSESKLGHEYRGLMGPSDISPTKQEQKLAIMSHTYAMPDHRSQPSHQTESVLMSVLTETPTRYGPQDFEQAHLSGLEVEEQPNAGSTQVLQQPAEGLLHNSANVQRDLDRSASLGAVSTRRLPLTDYSSFSVGETGPPHAIVGTNRELETISTSRRAQSEEKYDRNTKIKNFVAAQKALAKTGKTVLNNPETRLSEAEKMRASLGGIDAGVGIGNTAVAGDGFGYITNSKAVLNQEALSGPFVVPSAKEAPVTCWPNRGIDRSSLRKVFDVNSSEWASLKPITPYERNKMQMIMKMEALNMTETQGVLANRRESRVRPLEAIDWLSKDPRGMREARKEVEYIAQEWSQDKDTLNDVESATDVSSGQRTDSNTQFGTILAAGNMLANLTEYQDQQRNSTAPKDYFSKYKSAPEFAIDKVGSLGRTPKIQSYFEEDNAGFFKAPVRIARDPRFRPPGKEDVTSNAEDGWHSHHDMYGRR